MKHSRLVKRISGLLPYSISFFIILLLFFLGRPMFESNDDMGMLAIILGKLGFAASTDPIFISPIIGGILSTLYVFSPGGPWYGLMLYSLQFISLYLGIRIIFSIYNSNLERYFCVLALTGLYLPLFYKVNFTSTSLLLWFVSITYIIYLNLNEIAPKPSEIFLGLLLIVSFLLRPSIISIALSFSFPIFLSFITQQPSWKRVLYTILPLTVILGLSLLYGSIFISETRSDNYYRALQSARSGLTDTARGLPNENTALALATVGWTEADYQLARYFWVHDEVLYNVESINIFLDVNSPGIFPLSRDVLLFSIALNGTYIILLIFSVFYLLGTNNSIRTYNLKTSITLKESHLKHIIISLSIVFLIIGFIILSAIRMPARIANPILIYFLLLYVVVNPYLITLNSFRKSMFSRNFKLIISLSIIIAVTGFNIFLISSERNLFTSYKNAYEESIKEITESIGDNAVIIPVSPDYYLATAHPLKDFNDLQPFKSIPGGWAAGTNIYYQTLEKYSVSTGYEFMKYAVNNEKIIFCFLELSEGSFSQYEDFFKEHFNSYYVPPGYTSEIKVLLERQIGNSLSLIYFNIHTLKIK